jgi:hypothetical protein
MGCQGSKSNNGGDPQKTVMVDAKEAAKQEHLAEMKEKAKQEYWAEQAALGRVEQYRTEMKKIYTEHNSAELGDIDGMLEKNKGREQELYLSICNNYNVTPNPALVAEGGDSAVPAKEAPKDVEQEAMVAEMNSSMNSSEDRHPGVEKLEAGLVRI